MKIIIKGLLTSDSYYFTKNDTIAPFITDSFYSPLSNTYDVEIKCRSFRVTLDHLEFTFKNDKTVYVKISSSRYISIEVI